MSPMQEPLLESPARTAGDGSGDFQNRGTLMRRTKGVGSLKFRGNIWWLRYWANGVRVEESSQTRDRTKAEDLLKQKIAEAARGEIDVASKDATIADLCELVLADYRLRQLRSLNDVGWRFKKHIEPILGKVRGARFGATQVRQYVNQRRSEKAANSTINRELSVVRRAFTLGRREEPPLVSKVPYIPMLDEDNVRRGFIEEAQYQLLLGRLPEHLKAAFVVGYHCGNRLGEIRQLRPDQVHLEAREIRIESLQAKGKRDRVIPIYGDMAEWIERQLGDLPKGCQYLFHYRGRRLGSHLKGWSAACKDVGLEGLHFHDLRRSAIRNMDQAGVRQAVGMSISGHKTTDVYRRYNIVAAAELDEVGSKMAAFRQQQKPKLKRVK